MLCFCIVTQLKHISQYRDFLGPFHYGEVLDGLFHRRRIGIVSIQNDGVTAFLNDLGAVVVGSVSSNRLKHFVCIHAKILAHTKGGGDVIIKYRERLLYGTDFGISDNRNIEERKQWLEEEWRNDWKYFSTDSAMTAPAVPNPFKGLNLDENVLRKIYYENAMKWYPEAFR